MAVTEEMQQVAELVRTRLQNVVLESERKSMRVLMEARNAKDKHAIANEERNLSLFKKQMKIITRLGPEILYEYRRNPLELLSSKVRMQYAVQNRRTILIPLVVIFSLFLFSFLDDKLATTIAIIALVLSFIYLKRNRPVPDVIVKT